MNKKVLETILSKKIVAIIRGIKPNQIENTVDALIRGGINCIEVTFNQKDKETIAETIESLNFIKKRFKDEVCMGAGTVINKEQVKTAVEAGAEYIISPNTDLEVIKYTKELNKISIPGAFTPSEVIEAYNAGADIVKLFPAGLLGTKYIKAVTAPISHIPLVAVGGINVDNIKDFINAGAKGVGIGGSLVNVKAACKGDFDKITQTARRFVEKLEG